MNNFQKYLEEFTKDINLYIHKRYFYFFVLTNLPVKQFYSPPVSVMMMFVNHRNSSVS